MRTVIGALRQHLRQNPSQSTEPPTMHYQRSTSGTPEAAQTSEFYASRLQHSITSDDVGNLCYPG